MLFSNPEFRKLSILAFISALFIVAGFYLTMIHVVFQIIFLFVGVVNGVATLVGLIKLLVKMNNKDVAK